MVLGLLDQLLVPIKVWLRKSGHNELGLGVLRVGKGPVGDGGYGFRGVTSWRWWVWVLGSI